MVQNFVVNTKRKWRYFGAEYSCVAASRRPFDVHQPSGRGFVVYLLVVGRGGVRGSRGVSRRRVVARRLSRVFESSIIYVSSVAVISRVSAGRPSSQDGGLPCLSSSSLSNMIDLLYEFFTCMLKKKVNLDLKTWLDISTTFWLWSSSGCEPLCPCYLWTRDYHVCWTPDDHKATKLSRNFITSTT